LKSLDIRERNAEMPTPGALSRQFPRPDPFQNGIWRDGTEFGCFASAEHISFQKPECINDYVFY